MAFAGSIFMLLAFCACSLAAEMELEQPQMVFKPVKNLPAGIPTCSENDLKLNDCIKHAFQLMVPRMKNGISELNIPPLDPFELGKSSYSYNSGLLQGRIGMRDVLLHGLAATNVDKVDFRMREKMVRLEVAFSVPKLLVEGDYKADIKLNDVKLQPKGMFNISLTDVNLKARLMGELEERDGHTFLRLSKIDTDPKVADLRIYASGLSPDPALNSVMLEFINQYWRQLYQAMLPETLAILNPHVLKVANDFLAALPFDLLLTKN